MPSIGQNSTGTSSHPSGRSASSLALRGRSLQDGSSHGVPTKAAEASVHKALMALASRPAYGVTLALAGTIAHSWHVRGVRHLPLLGLDADTSYRLLSNHFPGIGRMMGVAWGELALPHVFDEAHPLMDLVDMLDQHRTVVDEDSTWLAHAVATSCLGADELWRDMNLPSASVLQDLLHDFFTILAARNRADLPWKQFFQQELADRAERRLRRNAGCADGGVESPDYTHCFGLQG